MPEAFALQIPAIGASTKRFVVPLLTAFAGGVFGVVLGALPSFIPAGFIMLLGEMTDTIIRQFEGVDLVTADKLGTGIIGSIGLGPPVGPHIAFTGDVVANVHAGRWCMDMDPSEGGYYFDKDITYAFGTQPSIPAVGGLFGVFGPLIPYIVGGIGLPFGSVTLPAITAVFIACIIFGYPFIDSPAGSGLLDMPPFEKGTMHGDGSGRSAAEPWLPHQYKWVNIAIADLGAGTLGGWTWLITESFFLTYGISAASLLLLNLGVKKMPVTYHITLGGSAFKAVAAPMIGGNESFTIIAAAVGGLTGVLLGEVTQRVAYVHSGMYVDPPAMLTTIYSLLIGTLFLPGVIPNSAYPGF